MSIAEREPWRQSSVATESDESASQEGPSAREMAPSIHNCDRF